MQLLKRVLLFFAEIGVLFAGLVLSIAVAYCLDRFSDGAGPLSFVFFFGPLILSAVGFFMFRRRSRRWKIKYDAANYLTYRSRRRLNPWRAKRIRTTWHCLRWVPSICAAFALFFLPVASRIVYPANFLVTGFRFSAPLNWMMIETGDDRPRSSNSAAIFSNEGAAHYGLTPMWFTHSQPSVASFSTKDSWVPDDWYRPNREAREGHPTHIAKNEFVIGTTTVKCFEYWDTYEERGNWYFPGWRSDPPNSLEILCSAQPVGRTYVWRAAFYGQHEDITAFYRVLKNATPTD